MKRNESADTVSNTALSQGWREHEGVVYFSVTSDGTTGTEWIARLEKKGLLVGDYAKQVLLSSDFKPTTGLTIEVGVLKGILFKKRQCLIENISKVAFDRNFKIPHAEIACLIREKFTDDDMQAMGFVWIVTMHEPIKDSVDDWSLLISGRLNEGDWLSTCFEDINQNIPFDGGFAFVVSCTKSQN